MHPTKLSVETKDIPRIQLKLRGRLASRSGLSGMEVEAMYHLLAKNFHGVIREVFQRDLEEKNWVILVEDQYGDLRGFTTFLMAVSVSAPRPTVVVYSGDTIVDPIAWGSPVLPRTWIQSIYALRADYPEGDLVWLLLTSGFRTYRFMSVFCAEFFPRFDAMIPHEMGVLRNALACERYGDFYDAKRGIVRFPKPQALRDHLAPVPEGRLSDPHIDFYLKNNPGHLGGDEFVSVASLAPENLTAAGRRMLA